MAYVTLNQLSNIPILLSKSASRLDEARAVRQATVFLSHSHLDDNNLVRVITLLENENVKVKLDKTETMLVGLSGTAAAPIIRESIRSCPKFIVALTTSIIGSRWIPWELGLADGMHGSNNVAIFPLLTRSTDEIPVEKEYLDTYPAVEWVHLEGHRFEEYCVRIPGTTRFWTLKEWLAK